MSKPSKNHHAFKGWASAALSAPKRSRRPRNLAHKTRMALRDWTAQHAREELLARWGSARAPEASLELAQPRWAMVLTTLPELLSPEKRARCDMLMGLAPQGAPPTDWPAVMLRAKALFDERAARRGLSTVLSTSLRQHFFSPSDLDSNTDAEWCSGRCVHAMPAYGSRSRVSSIFKETLILFDRRRVWRRQDKPVPRAWFDQYGPIALELWHSGMSAPRERSIRFDKWSSCADVIASAMAETGLDTRLCEGFFTAFPQAMDEQALMERIDVDMLDELRSRWSIEQESPTLHRSSPTHKSL